MGPGATASVASHAVPSAKVLLFAKYAGWGTAAAFVILGVIATILTYWIIGPICIAIGLFMAILEVPFTPIAWLLNFFQDFRFRGALYIVFCIPSFFSIITFIAGLGSIACGCLYLFAGIFKKEKGTPIERPFKKQPADVEAPAEQPKSKKDRKSMASQGAAPGVI